MRRLAVLLKCLLVLLTAVISVPDAALATFSGKNGRIAFTQGPDIFTVKSDGTDVQQLTFYGPDNGACCVAWSSDGEQMVFQAAFAPDFLNRLWVMNADGSNQHQLLNDDDTSILHFFPSWSPDGNEAIVSRCKFGDNLFQCAIYRVNINGTGLVAVTPFGSNRDIIDWQPAYSPDGKTIAFTSLWRDGLISAIYLMDSDGSNIRPLTPPELLANAPDWSPDGRRIAFSTNGQQGILNEELWVIKRKDGGNTRENARGTNLIQLTDNPGLHDEAAARRDFWPSWSPQGDAITFERANGDFSESGIYVIRSDGAGEKLMFRGSSANSARAMGPTRKAAQERMRRRLGKRFVKLIEQGGRIPRWGAMQ